MIRKGMHLSSRPKREGSISKQYRQPIKLKPSNYLFMHKPLEISSDFNNISCRTMISTSPHNHLMKLSCQHTQQYQREQTEEDDKVLKIKIEELRRKIESQRGNVKEMQIMKQKMIIRQNQEEREMMEEIKMLEKEQKQQRQKMRKLKYYEGLEGDLADIENKIYNMINM